jgi:hypothetical protein
MRMIINNTPLRARVAALVGIVVGIVLTGIGVAAGLLVLVLSIGRAIG